MARSGGAQDTKKQWDVQHVLLKQRAALSTIREGNAQLKDELMLENRFSVQPSTQSAAAYILNLREQSDVYTKKIEAEMQRVAELSEQAAHLQQTVSGQRRQMGGLDAATKEENQAKTQIKLLENRLEKAYHVLNESCAQNRCLRGQVEDLRRERLVFDDLHRKLEAQLTVQQAEEVSLIETMNSFFEQGCKAFEDMATLKAQSDKEQTTFEAEWRQLTKLIETDRRSRESLRAAEIEDRDRKTSALFKSVIPRAANAQSDKLQAARATSEHSNVQRLDELTHAFAKVQDATGMKDMAELADALAAVQDHSFSLFGFVGELNLEVERLEERAAHAADELERSRTASSLTQAQRMRQIQAWAAKLATAKQQTLDMESKRAEASSASAALREGVAELFHATGCDTLAVRTMLGEGQVTDENMMQYLGILEQRAVQLIQTYGGAGSAAAAAAAAGAGGTLPPLASGPPSVASGEGNGVSGRGVLHASSTIEPPTSLGDAVDDNDDIDKESKPLDRAALVARVAQGLAQRAEAAKNSTPGAPTPRKLSRRR